MRENIYLGGKTKLNISTKRVYWYIKSCAPFFFFFYSFVFDKLFIGSLLLIGHRLFLFLCLSGCSADGFVRSLFFLSMFLYYYSPPRIFIIIIVNGDICCFHSLCTWIFDWHFLWATVEKFLKNFTFRAFSCFDCGGADDWEKWAFSPAPTFSTPPPPPSKLQSPLSHAPELFRAPPPTLLQHKTANK